MHHANGPQPPKETLVVGRPNVLDRDGFMDDVAKILDSRLLTNDGPFVLQLERDVAAFLQVPHVIAVRRVARRAVVAAH